MAFVVTKGLVQKASGDSRERRLGSPNRSRAWTSCEVRRSASGPGPEGKGLVLAWRGWFSARHFDSQNKDYKTPHPCKSSTSNNATRS